jgi:hypothetical protein
MLDDAEFAPTTPGIRAGVMQAWYNPERDYALLSPFILKEVFKRLYPPPLDDPDYAKLLEGYSDEELRELFCRAATVLCKCERLFIEDNDPTSRMKKLLEQGGFFTELPGVIRLAVLAMMGELFMGTLFSGTRDLTPVDGRPAYERILNTILDEGARVGAAFTKRPGSAAPAGAEQESP